VRSTAAPVEGATHVAAFDSDGTLADTCHILDGGRFILSARPGRYEVQAFRGDPAQGGAPLGRRQTVLVDGESISVSLEDP
jgi:hypothetical protein